MLTKHCFILLKISYFYKQKKKKVTNKRQKNIINEKITRKIINIDQG